MNQRLQQFLSAENISQSQFADTIGVARASVSHILAGRNKPGFDFILGMAKAFPTLNIDWLITGKGKMYRQGGTKLYQEPEIFDNQSIEFPPDQEKTTIQTPLETVQATKPTPLPDISVIAKPIEKTSAGKTESTSINSLSDTTEIIDNKRTIERIIVFYSDNTFKELK